MRPKHCPGGVRKRRWIVCRWTRTHPKARANSSRLRRKASSRRRSCSHRPIRPCTSSCVSSIARTRPRASARPEALLRLAFALRAAAAGALRFVHLARFLLGLRLRGARFLLDVVVLDVLLQALVVILRGLVVAFAVLLVLLARVHGSLLTSSWRGWTRW